MDLQHLIALTAFLVFVLLMLAVDLFVLHRNPHVIRFREALIGALLPVGMAIVFAGLLYYAYEHKTFGLGIVPEDIRNSVDAHLWPQSGTEASILFATGYLVELSLSADNVFLFVVLMNFFRVPLHLQHRVLFWGVLGALVMRGIMIGAGSVLLIKFHGLIYLFGAFLVFTGIRMLFSGDAPTDPAQSFIVRTTRRLMPFSPDYDGQRFFTRIDGKRCATTLLLVLICIEFTDLVFALDSIPAIFGITQDWFIVFTSNVFAILGLRSMYFLLAGVMTKFHYLKYGLALVLGFVGVKMLAPLGGSLYGHATGTPPQEWVFDKYLSLAIILGTLALSIIASLVFPKKEPLEHNPQQTP